MKDDISRRSFVKKSAMLGAAAFMGAEFLPGLPVSSSGSLIAAEKVDLSVVNGSNFFQNTFKAVQQLGGMESFVSKGSKVGLLLNSPFKNYGAHVKPEISLAVVKMCYEAGAKEIYLLKEGYSGYWQRSKLATEYADEIKSLKPGWENFIDHMISDAVTLGEPSITRTLLDCDVFINVSILKQHEGIGYTCSLKNMMGTSSTRTNMSMHFGGKLGLSFFPDVGYLSQCIVDLNTIRRPDLCIVDTTEFITEKGPYGPGKLAKPHLVVAGTDRVAVDAYCVSALGLDRNQLPIIKMAAQRGLGNSDLTKINIREVAG
ncbi:MAG: DUF362 domain-containing protein [Deltaproteobacteria bacterium]|jgi:uncharacterized protein (DUF362 family)|nr:DUF362 domain-containing protein [Deltaproteobacteria bacterium]MBT7890362.1 DUF362 domain-containing protein [Deltaproteobacteria bacterium]